MLGTLLIFGILPMMLAVGLIALSLWAASQGPLVIQLPLSVVTVALAGWGLFVLIRILMGAWPTALPHLAMGCATPLAIAQLLTARANQRRAGAH